jgi:DMSO/TMAO reductase YedYZ heme-binding membrane subunit
MDRDRRDRKGSSGRMEWLRRHWLRLSVNVAALAPLLLLVWWLVTDRLFLDPVKQITIRTGRLAITFLLLSLACTPLASLTGVSRIRRARRPLGLWSLVTTALHFLTFVTVAHPTFKSYEATTAGVLQRLAPDIRFKC